MNREDANAHRPPAYWPKFVYGAILIALIAGGLYCGYLAFTTIKDFAAHTQFRSISGLPFFVPTVQAPSEATGSDQPASRPSAPQQEIIMPSIEDKERVNILVMGIDQRPGESAATRTDTMMLVSIDPKDMSVSILSIPRDLWVAIPHPNHEKDRINTAHLWGEMENYPGGGPALAMQTIEYNFGVPVHYYVRLNFTGFERMVDYIGGIDIDVPKTIDDYEYPTEDYRTTHLHIDAGLQHFDGEMALKYARTRKGTGDGDFSRMSRQQAVILAIRDKVLRLKNLPQLIVQAPNLVREMGDSVETNMPVQEMIVLAEWAQKVERENIHTATIDRELTSDWMTPNGEMVLLYDRAKARPLIDALFSDPTPEATVTETTTVQKVASEHARVAVYNGSAVDGLAGRTQSFLEMQGIDAFLDELPDRTQYGQTTICVYEEKPYTTEWLIGWLAEMGISEPVVEQRTASTDADLAVIIGLDFPADKLN
ncbi:MAG: LCP family protein [Anaerolineae bacterium]|jgi:LCP family protein required for cell wall assembly